MSVSVGSYEKKRKIDKWLEENWSNICERRITKQEAAKEATKDLNFKVSVGALNDVKTFKGLRWPQTVKNISNYIVEVLETFKEEILKGELSTSEVAVLVKEFCGKAPHPQSVSDQWRRMTDQHWPSNKKKCTQEEFASMVAKFIEKLLKQYEITNN
jgi:hypothetical protein